MKILLADDEPEIVRLYHEMLEGNGHTVATAFDGVETLARLAESDHDLLILDLHMPKKDGFHVLTEMREGGNRTPVIIMTGHYLDEVIAEKIQGLDVGEVLRKPVMITALLNAVNRLASGPG